MRAWTDDELDFLARSFHNRVPARKIAESLGRTIPSIEKKRNAMGYTRHKCGNRKGGRSGDSLCWQCSNATGGCSWSDRLEPVEGWSVARKKYTEGILTIVMSCPEFQEG